MIEIKGLTAQVIDVNEYSGVSYFGTMNLGNRTAVHVQIEPATAAALWKIGIAILSNVGAKALSNWLGLDNKQDLKELLSELLENIVYVIRSSLDQNEVKLAQDQISAVNVLIREYLNSPETSKFRIEESVIKSATANETLERLLPVSTPGYILGVLVRLSALQELSNITGSEGEQKNVGDYANKAAPIIRTAFDQLIAINDERVSPLTVKVEHKIEKFVYVHADADLVSRDPGEPSFRYTLVTVRYSVDGVDRAFEEKGDGHNIDNKLINRASSKASASRNSDLDRVRVDFMSSVGIPIVQSLQNIEKIAEKFKKT